MLVTHQSVGPADFGVAAAAVPRPRDRAVSPTHAQKVLSAQMSQESGALRRKFRKAVRKTIMLNRLGVVRPGGAVNMSGDASRTNGEGFSSRALHLPPPQEGDGAQENRDEYINNISDIYQYGLQRKADIDPLPWFVFSPDHPWRLVWDVVLLLLVVGDGIVVPYRMAFEVKAVGAAAVYNDFVTVFFLLDIILNMMTSYRDKGVVVIDRAAIAKRYLKTWFVLDMAASLPVDWFIADEEDDGSSGAARWNSLLRLVRLFKLFRILRLLKLFPKIFSMLEGSISFNPSLVRFLRSFAVLLLSWHWIGCLYWAMAVEEYGGTEPCEHDPTRTCFVNACSTLPPPLLLQQPGCPLLPFHGTGALLNTFSAGRLPTTSNVARRDAQLRRTARSGTKTRRIRTLTSGFRE